MKAIPVLNPIMGRFNCAGRYVMPPPARLPEDAACANCESYDHGDCHNPHSDRFTPEADHVCAAWFRSTT